MTLLNPDGDPIPVSADGEVDVDGRTGEDPLVAELNEVLARKAALVERMGRQGAVLTAPFQLQFRLDFLIKHLVGGHRLQFEIAFESALVEHLERNIDEAEKNLRLMKLHASADPVNRQQRRHPRR